MAYLTEKLEKLEKNRVVYRFFTPPPLAGIGKLLALFGWYFGIGITVQDWPNFVSFCCFPCSPLMN
jgi:hypothetical protein